MTATDSQAAPRDKTIKKILQIANAGESLLVVGEPGSGKSFIAKTIKEQAARPTILIKDETPKQALIKICQELKLSCNGTIPEIAKTITTEWERKDHLLIVDDGDLLSPRLRKWIAELPRVVIFATKPQRELIIRLPRITLEPLSEEETKSIIRTNNPNYSSKQIAEIVALAGGNPGLAKKAAKEIDNQLEPHGEDQTQWIDATPFVVGAISLIFIVRYLGIGLGDRNLYAMGAIIGVVSAAVRSVLVRMK